MKTILRKFSAGALVVGTLFTVAGVSQGAVTFASLLLPGASFQVGDKLFYNFGNVNQTGDLTVSYDDIEVSAITNGPLNHGISFQSGLWTLAGPDLTYDLKFSFNVKVLDPCKVIIGNELAIIGTYGGSGSSIIAEVVSDTAMPVNGVANQGVFLNLAGADQTSDSDTYLPNTYTELLIQKDFAMNTSDVGSDFIFVSHFDQTFSQMELSCIPEPATTLGGLLVAGGLLIRRRTRLTR